MNKLLFLLSIVLVTSSISCDSSDSGDSEARQRITFANYFLDMTHNSHLNRSFSDEGNSFSLVGDIEILLSELTNYEEIQGIRIVDEELDGWEFNPSEIANAYNEEDNSLIFRGLQLRELKSLSDVRAQILDETGEVLMERLFDISPNLPLPATSILTYPDDSNLRIDLEFYETPFDGGNIPFPVTIYNTFFSSNSFAIIWLDADRNTIREDFYSTGDLLPITNDATNDEYYITYSISELPENTAYIYTRFRRGRFNSQTDLLTRLHEHQ